MRHVKYALCALAIVLVHAIDISAQSSNPTTSFVCTPVGVASWAGLRVHVQCATGPTPALIFFAVANTDAASAQRFQDIAMAGYLNKQPLTMVFTPGDTSGSTFGCDPSNCVAAAAITIGGVPAPSAAIRK